MSAGYPELVDDAPGGYALCFGSCVTCGRGFYFNPLTVPSTDTFSPGTKQAVCRVCMERVNALRAGRGLEPFAIAPDAYEPVAAAALP